MDIFSEVMHINELIRLEEEFCEKLLNYFDDMIQKSFEEGVLYVNIDICLDYIDFSNYSILLSQNLKEILKNIQMELKEHGLKIEYLKNLLKEKILMIVKFSTLNQFELQKLLEIFPIKKVENLDTIQSLPVFVDFKETVQLSFLASQILSMDALLLIVEYVKQKCIDNSLNFISYLEQYGLLNDFNIKR